MTRAFGVSILFSRFQAEERAQPPFLRKFFNHVWRARKQKKQARHIER